MVAPGVIVNISSTTALRAIPNSVAYVVSKTAIIGRLRVDSPSSSDLAEDGCSRRLPALFPHPDLRVFWRIRAREWTWARARVGTHWVMRSQLMTSLVCCIRCASDLARAVTGVVIPVDGGKSVATQAPSVDEARRGRPVAVRPGSGAHQIPDGVFRGLRETAPVQWFDEIEAFVVSAHELIVEVSAPQPYSQTVVPSPRAHDN